ncbi:MAG TPA: hypothetical protein PL033_08680 [Candidatus Brocadiia bacterium]|nr:hypothetical protein [Candidatus Brocadiia bacterium]
MRDAMHKGVFLVAILAFVARQTGCSGIRYNLNLGDSPLALVEADGSISLRSPVLYSSNTEVKSLETLQVIPGLRALPDGLCWSSDGGTIFYISDAAGTPDIWQVNLETRSRAPLRVTPWRESEPHLLPGGDRIAFLSDEGGMDDIWIFELATRRAYPLTRDEAGESPLRTSIKAKTSVFASHRLDGKCDIVIARWPGGELFRFPVKETDIIMVDISADGEKVAWASGDTLVEAKLKRGETPQLEILRRLNTDDVAMWYSGYYGKDELNIWPVDKSAGNKETIPIPDQIEAGTSEDARAGIISCIEALPAQDALQWRIGHFPSWFEERIRKVHDIAESSQGEEWAEARMLSRACLAFRTEELEALLEDTEVTAHAGTQYAAPMPETASIVRFLLANVYQTEGRFPEALKEMRRFCLEWGNTEAVAYVPVIDELLKITSRYPYVVDRWMRAERLARRGPWAFWRILAPESLDLYSTKRELQECLAVQSRGGEPAIFLEAFFPGLDEAIPAMLDDPLIREALAEYRIVEERYPELETSSWALFRLASLSPDWARLPLYRRYLHGRRRDMFFEPAVESLVEFSARQRCAGSAYELLRDVHPADDSENAAVIHARERLLHSMVTRD